VTRANSEEEIHRLCGAADYRAAATRLLEQYGSEILGLLCSRLRSESNGREVFGMFCEDLWRALPSFEFRCSARTWAYVLARHAELRFRSEPQRRPDRNLPFSDQLDHLAERARTSTSPFRRTNVQQRLRDLRRRLGERDELMLLLRVDRGLSWREIARVFVPCGPNAEDLEIEREAARLRQRFQVLKQRLRQWAEAEGLLHVEVGGRDHPEVERAPLPHVRAPAPMPFE
jgi:RNA polymerase sigma-70 factor (ECF subfamily)